MGEDKRPTLAALRERLRDGKRLPPGALEALEHDPRAGAAELRRLIEDRRRKERAETQRLHRMLAPERAARAEGLAVIAGVDEAGMAPLAGPVVAAAAILPEDMRPRELDDSKKVDPETRERLAAEIKAGAVAWAVGLATVQEIDKLNIYHAGLLAMRRAVEGLAVRPDVLLVDARRVPGVDMPQRPMIHGDELSLSIAAASVIAKTHRDSLMRELDGRYPGYGLSAHKGYPTPEHLAALMKLGACEIHRRTFGPVRVALGLEPVQQELF
ncbi:MAG TPA: ribonuclease HII [Myxococcales bacterium]|nr:ribonuclease HII [Myxococcales bacterium]